MTKPDQDQIAHDDLPMTREEWGIDRLRYWLARPHWSGVFTPDGPPLAEGVCLLAGIDPELSCYTSGDHPAAGLWFLPEGLAAYDFETFPRGRDELDTLWDLITRRASDMVGMWGKAGPVTADPHDWIMKTKNHPTLAPPWLSKAQADPACVELLPTALRPKSARRWKKPSEKGGSTRPENEVIAIFICDALRNSNTAAKVFRLFDKHKADWNLSPGESTVRTWCNQALKDTNADAFLLTAGNSPEDVARLKAEAMRMLAEKSLVGVTSAR